MNHHEGEDPGKMERRCRKGSSSARSEEMERVGGIFFDRPKPTAGCSANGRRRRRRIILLPLLLLFRVFSQYILEM
jgi:hypothetical protein